MCVEAHKICSACKKDLPRDSFGTKRSTSDGLSAYCKSCNRAYSKRTRAGKSVVERKRNNHAEYLLRKHRGTITPATKSKEQRRRYHLMERYNITVEELDSMVQEQGSACAVCGSKNKLQVDHDHVTGKVRGLLCSTCNLALGLLKESPLAMMNLISYWQNGLHK